MQLFDMEVIAWLVVRSLREISPPPPLSSEAMEYPES